MSKEHSTVQSAKVHEPKHITVSSTGDNGKIITPSDTDNGESVLEYPKAERLDSESAVVGTLLAADGSGGMAFEPVPGVVYGNMSFHGSTDTTTVADTNFHPIDTGWGGAGIIAGPLNGMTFSSGLLTATYAGTYFITGIFSLTLAAGTNDVLEWDIGVDGAAKGDSQMRFIANTSDIGSMGISHALAITAGQTIGILIKVDAADNLTVHGFDLTAIRLGP